MFDLSAYALRFLEYLVLMLLFGVHCSVGTVCVDRHSPTPWPGGHSWAFCW